MALSVYARESGFAALQRCELPQNLLQPASWRHAVVCAAHVHLVRIDASALPIRIAFTREAGASFALGTHRLDSEVHYAGDCARPLQKELA